MSRLNDLERKIATQKKELSKKNLLIGIFTNHVGFDESIELARANNYAISCLAIDLGKKPTQEQIELISNKITKE